MSKITLSNAIYTQSSPLICVLNRSKLYPVINKPEKVKILSAHFFRKRTKQNG